jgi:beta-N-acetylhexosaminidase
MSLTVSLMMLGCGPLTAYAEDAAGTVTGTENAGSIEEMLSSMTLDDKISQMIIPAVRSWDDVNLTDLSACPELKEALRAHQYGGIILFGANVADPGQVTALVHELQANNLENTETAVHIPYFMAADEEGGIVVRLSGGTRMTGNMAIGATGEGNGEVTGDKVSTYGEFGCIDGAALFLKFFMEAYTFDNAEGTAACIEATPREHFFAKLADADMNMVHVYSSSL